MKLTALILFCVLVYTGCSEQNENDTRQEHVWQEQTDTMDKARAVEDLLQQSAEDQKRQIEEQSR